MCIYFNIIRQNYLGRITRVPPRDKKVPERLNVPTFYEQMLKGLTYATQLTFIVFNNFSSKKFVASVKNMMVYFELKQWEFYVFGDFKRENV